MYTSANFDSQVIELLNGGGIGVGLTDTIYGLLARADNRQAVDRTYAVKSRNTEKQCIVLLDTADQLLDYGVDQSYMDRARPYWPGPVTLVLPVVGADEHLLRGGDTLAFRVPDNRPLRKLIRQTGPLIAPSANPEGLEPALSIKQAKDYFADTVDFYVGNSSVITARASTILRLEPNTVCQLR